MITFESLNVGEVFVFAFEENSTWFYKKVGARLIECVNAPKTQSKEIGKVHVVDSHSLIHGKVRLLNALR
jgi:hypothetical protein